MIIFLTVFVIKIALDPEHNIILHLVFLIMFIFCQPFPESGSLCNKIAVNLLLVSTSEPILDILLWPRMSPDCCGQFLEYLWRQIW